MSKRKVDDVSFVATFDDLSTFKKIIDGIKEVVQDGHIDVKSSGISFQAMDTSRISLVALSLTAEGFRTYQCDRDILIGTNFESLAKVLRVGGKDDTLTIRAEGVTPTVLNFVFKSEDESRVVSYDLHLLEIQSEFLTLPDAPYQNNIMINSNDLHSVIKNFIGLGAESLKISGDSKQVVLNAVSKLGTGTITFTTNTQGKMEFEIIGPFAFEYGMNYLDKFMKCSGLSPTVKLFLDENFPMLLEYRLKEDTGFLRFYLAPKLPLDVTDE
jgi:proliferating cell nuclear antigen